ncbi:energy-coupling factor ABC transporter permease [Pseudoalteromonas sp. BDTF-M6]|uniref:energy-coupling factor ABC transporter permease n=1 Tax=Pseudoalteromonas sp. BDTF-M6 TaxID=2796132 RepID=UPI001BAEB28A|nr:energy-coupling factor ABC transporter permease [Pseudoalteromonas sp. BDTF-M6]MBS3796921.1 energy-coupling factor ABC transporter permease [Pseudoalteromonas sp. BDTF-M6]
MLVSTLALAIILMLTLDKPSLLGLWHRPARQTGLFACALVLALLWRIKAGIAPGLDIHILGITAMTLILGWRLATLAAILATALLASFSTIAWENAAVFVITTALIPIYFSYGVFVLVYNLLPRHLFIYLFVCSFLCAALANCLKILVGALYYWAIGTYEWSMLMDNYVILSALIWFPEAMLTGMAMTLLVIYRPHWVRTFYDKEYLAP